MEKTARPPRKNKGSTKPRSKGVFGGGLRAAIYARVSTSDQHTIPEQLRQLEAFAAHRGWSVVSTVHEVASGAVKRAKRDALIAAAHRRELDAIIVWKLDRWGRSLIDLMETLNELTALGVAFVSLTEALDFSTPSGRALAGMLAVFAEFERDLIRERVRGGIERARRAGKHLGRPPTAAAHAAEVRALRKSGRSHADIARQVGIGESSVRRILAGQPRSQKRGNGHKRK